MKLMVGKKSLKYSQLEFDETDQPTPAFIHGLASKYHFKVIFDSIGTSTCPHLEFLYDFLARTSDSPAEIVCFLSREKIIISKKEMGVMPWRVLAMRNRTVMLSRGKIFSPIYKSLSNWERDFQSKKLLPIYRSSTFPDLQSFFNYFTALRVLLSTRRVFQSPESAIDDFIYQYTKIYPTVEGVTPLPPLAYVESVMSMVPLNNLSSYRAMLLHRVFSSTQLNDLMGDKHISLPLLADVVEANSNMSTVELLELFDEMPKAWLKKLYWRS